MGMLEDGVGVGQGLNSPTLRVGAGKSSVGRGEWKVSSVLFLSPRRIGLQRISKFRVPRPWWAPWRQQVARKEIPTFLPTLPPLTHPYATHAYWQQRDAIRPIRTYIRLVRTNGNAGPSGDVLRICPHLISRSSPLEVNLKCFTRFESGFQVPGQKRLLFPRGEIPPCPYNVLDLDGDVCQLRD
jgi:hypothetical protein